MLAHVRASERREQRPGQRGAQRAATHQAQPREHHLNCHLPAPPRRASSAIPREPFTDEIALQAPAEAPPRRPSGSLTALTRTPSRPASRRQRARSPTATSRRTPASAAGRPTSRCAGSPSSPISSMSPNTNTRRPCADRSTGQRRATESGLALRIVEDHRPARAPRAASASRSPRTPPAPRRSPPAPPLAERRPPPPRVHSSRARPGTCIRTCASPIGVSIRKLTRSTWPSSIPPRGNPPLRLDPEGHHRALRHRAEHAEEEVIGVEHRHAVGGQVREISAFTCAGSPRASPAAPRGSARCS